MRYKDFEFYASSEDTSVNIKKTFFCEIYHAEDEGMANMLDCFNLKEGSDIPVNSEPALIKAVQKHIDNHYEKLMAAHKGLRTPEKSDYLQEFLHNTDFDLLYQQKQALLTVRERHIPVDKETIDGLVHFLDFIGDWAEQEGVFQYPSLEEKHSFIDELTALAEEELNDAGKITYFTPDNKYLIIITVERASEDMPKPGEKYYCLSCMQNFPDGDHDIFSGRAAYNDFDTLRSLCETAASWIESRKSPDRPSLNAMISHAATRTASTPSSSGKVQEPEISS